MSGDPRIAPSPAREHRAWRAGMRPRSRWIVAGLYALAAAAFCRSVDVQDLAEAIGWSAELGTPDVGGALARLSVGLVWIAGAVLAVSVLAGLFGGSLGPVSPLARRGLSLRPVAAASTFMMMIGLGLVPLVAWTLRGTLAAAARAPAASEGGLHALWSGALVHTLAITGGLLVLGGAIELLWARRALWHALHRTEAEVRADRRASGGGGE